MDSNNRGAPKSENETQTLHNKDSENASNTGQEQTSGTKAFFISVQTCGECACVCDANNNNKNKNREEN